MKDCSQTCTFPKKVVPPARPRHPIRHCRGERPLPLTPPNSFCTCEHQHSRSSTNEQLTANFAANIMSRIKTLHFIFAGKLHNFLCAVALLSIHTPYARSQTLAGLHTLHFASKPAGRRAASAGAALLLAACAPTFCPAAAHFHSTTSCLPTSDQ